MAKEQEYFEPCERWFPPLVKNYSFTLDLMNTLISPKVFISLEVRNIGITLFIIMASTEKKKKLLIIVF